MSRRAARRVAQTHLKKMRASTGRQHAKAKKTVPSTKPRAKRVRAGSAGASKEIHVGSDCTGYGSEIIAFEQLQLPQRIVHDFASEKDPAVQGILAANHPNLNTIYEDVTTRNLASSPAVDIYMNTSPCIAFSLMGSQERPTSSHHSVEGREVEEAGGEGREVAEGVSSVRGGR